MAFTPWPPSSFVRYVESFRSSTLVARIVTDSGPAYLKAINNPQGPHVLVCDWIGTHLARRIGLQTFDVALLELTDGDEIPVGDALAQTGQSFVTRDEEGEPVGGETVLASIVNPEHIPLLIVFDTWVRNCDRYAPGMGQGGRARMRLDNLFLSSEDAPSGQFVLKAIDHGDILTCGRELTPRLAHIDFVRDEVLYGFFPIFSRYVTSEQIVATGEILQTARSEMWADILGSVPTGWQLPNETRDAINRFLLERARFLRDNLEHIVNNHMNQPHL